MKYNTLHETHEYREKIDDVAPSNGRATTTARSLALSDEAKLVQRVSQGNRDALIALYENNVDRIYRFFYKKVGNTAEAEDLTSELFTRAIEALMRRQYVWQGKPFGAWLVGIANYMLMERWRKLSGLPSIEPLDLEVFEPASQEMDISDALAQKEEQTALWDLVNKLSSAEQGVLIMRYTYGLSYSEISMRLKRSEIACKQLHYRALMKLKRLIQNDSSILG